MKFEELHELVPHARFGKAKVLQMQPYNGVTLAMPGRHSEDTAPKGGDFVVMVDDDSINWIKHQFTHTDIFKDIQKKVLADHEKTAKLMEDYYDSIVHGKHPATWEGRDGLPGLHPQTFIYATQCLGVAEHRRYAQHEPKGGGRYLPLRFAAGIVAGNWDSTGAAEKQKRGRPGVEWLEREFGIPPLTQQLLTYLSK